MLCPIYSIERLLRRLNMNSIKNLLLIVTLCASNMNNGMQRNIPPQRDPHQAQKNFRECCCYCSVLCSVVSIVCCSDEFVHESMRHWACQGLHRSGEHKKYKIVFQKACHEYRDVKID